MHGICELNGCTFLAAQIACHSQRGAVCRQTRVVGVESGKPQVLLEACVENATKGTLFLEYVRFDATQSLTAARIAPALAEKPPQSHGRSGPGASVAAYAQGLQVCFPECQGGGSGQREGDHWPKPLGLCWHLS